MFIARYDENHLGLVQDDRVVDVTYTLDLSNERRWPAPLGDPLVRHLDEVRAAVADRPSGAAALPIGSVHLDSPLTTPTKILAAPANYRSHVERDAADPGVDQGVHRALLEGMTAPTEELGLFLKAGSSITGPAGGVRIPFPARRTDHEVELAVVIGRGGFRIAAEDSMAHVAGYCIGLDMTVRGREDRSFRKSADGFTVLGPWLTTADEVSDPAAIDLWLSVNGQERQRSSTADMTVGIPRLIELASAMYTLHPGDVIMTGTPDGVGPVEPGDVIVAGATGLGEMTVEVRA